MTRRELLATVGIATAGGLAGCLDGDGCLGGREPAAELVDEEFETVRGRRVAAGKRRAAGDHDRG
ncbi:hypothetical protein [Halovivax sp.]|uniref:hypothetical protein n=1 Tax=Halovivax sp. TaxID=1935978 RepID=UPI0025C16327|nr:hypothetical protein [Halovivax sp.]